MGRGRFSSPPTPFAQTFCFAESVDPEVLSIHQCEMWGFITCHFLMFGPNLPEICINANRILEILKFRFRLWRHSLPKWNEISWKLHECEKIRRNDWLGLKFDRGKIWGTRNSVVTGFLKFPNSESDCDVIVPKMDHIYPKIEKCFRCCMQSANTLRDTCFCG